MSYSFVKGHGTENDFVIVPAGVELTAERARALCDRRAGIGGDGVIRAVRKADNWFLDYRNSDGSVSEMCGNGIRLYAHYLHEVEGEPFPMEIDTRAGLKWLTSDGDHYTVDMGRRSPRVLGETKIRIGDRSWPALHVTMGNPHAVVFVDELGDAGPLHDPPEHDPAVYPDGVNVEFVVRRGERHLAMRVHERGSGETRSCGTGACAVAVAAAALDGATEPTTYRVDVPGGTLAVTLREGDRVLLGGPAVIVAEGTTDL